MSLMLDIYSMPVASKTLDITLLINHLTRA